MKKSVRGRPKGASKLDREPILEVALLLLEEGGAEALSMRGLAQRLNVTPMALYHHFSDRQALFRALSSRVYAEVLTRFERAPAPVIARIQYLLESYHESVVRYPQLALVLFANPDAFSEELSAINDQLTQLFAKTSLPVKKRPLWRDILVDFTHGSALAIAASKGARVSTRQKKEYAQRLAILLRQAF